MTTAMHYEALRKERLLQRAREARDRPTEKVRVTRPDRKWDLNPVSKVEEEQTDGEKAGEKKETVDRDEMARVIYKDLHRQEKRLRDSCLVMGPLEKYVDDEYISKKVEEAQKSRLK
jgi:hypothetical protein